jgi:peptidase M50-like protein
MELIAEREQYIPTSTPVLDVLRPLSYQERDRLSTANCVFISSAVILIFTTLPAIRALLDSVSAQPLVFWTTFLVVPLLGFLCSLAVHEAGHLLAASLCGFEPVRVKFGPFRFKSKRFTNNFYCEQVVSLGIAVLHARSGEKLRRRLFWLVVSGPLASFLLPLAAETMLYLVPATRNVPYLLITFGVHVFSAASVLVGVTAFLPEITSSGEFSDGARLLMLLKNNGLAARWMAIIKLQLALNAGTDRRDWDEALVADAVAEKDESLDGAAAHWLAYLWAVGCHEITLATKYLDEALACLGTADSHLRDRILLEAAVFQAWYRHNSAKAQFWVLQVGNPQSLSPLQMLRAEIALCWVEGKTFKAWEKLGDYLVRLREIPASSLRDLVEKDALEWKDQMESRMLAGAWANMIDRAQEIEVGAISAQ